MVKQKHNFNATKSNCIYRIYKEHINFSCHLRRGNAIDGASGNVYEMVYFSGYYRIQGNPESTYNSSLRDILNCQAIIYHFFLTTSSLHVAGFFCLGRRQQRKCKLWRIFVSVQRIGICCKCSTTDPSTLGRNVHH